MISQGNIYANFEVNNRPIFAQNVSKKCYEEGYGVLLDFVSKLKVFKERWAVEIQVTSFSVMKYFGFIGCYYTVP